MNGTILGIVDKRIVYQNNSTKPNRNIFVVGGPGSYKTQSVVITNLFNETENSIVVTDPKGELYEKTAGIKLAQGYQVHVVNFANMAHSDRYNPFWLYSTGYSSWNRGNKDRAKWKCRR